MYIIFVNKKKKKLIIKKLGLTIRKEYFQKVENQGINLLNRYNIIFKCLFFCINCFIF
jgi:hypothetical protein